MANFTNRATLSYNNGTVNSNTVTGEIREVLSITKTAVSDSYAANDIVTYIVTLVNKGAVGFTNLTLTDDLGGYLYENATVYPLTYAAGSIKYYVNGALQPAPTVTAGPPLAIEGISVPADGSTTIIYQARTNAYTPLGLEASVVNTVTASGGGLATPIQDSAELFAVSEVDLTITKALCPTVITENGTVNYTLTVQNFGNTAATAADNAVITDTFNPILKQITVTFNGAEWTAPDDYTYSEETGVFQTVAGKITVPAATYTRNADGTFTVTPGISTLVISGTI